MNDTLQVVLVMIIYPNWNPTDDTHKDFLYSAVLFYD